MIDIIIAAVIIILAIFAAKSVIKRKGKCSCGCDGCSMNCSKNDKK